MSPQLTPDEILQSHLATLAQWDEHEVRQWLLEGFSSGQFDRIPMVSDPSPPLEIEKLFRAAPPSGQHILKQGVTLALSEWTPRAFAYEVFSELARTAAHLRASKSIAHIAQHLLSDAFKEPASDEMEDACDIGVAVLHGFVPNEAVIPVFLQMYRSERFERYAAHLFLGLCECTPAGFANYVSRFVTIVRQRPGDFHLESILHEFEKVVPQEIVQQKQHDLIRNAQYFVSLIHRYTQIPLLPPVPLPEGGYGEPVFSAPEARAIFNFHERRIAELGVAEVLKIGLESLSSRPRRSVEVQE